MYMKKLGFRYMILVKPIVRRELLSLLYQELTILAI